MKEAQRPASFRKVVAMHYRFHVGTPHPSGKWEHQPHTGVGHVWREATGDWQLEMTHRQVGMTIKRDQYAVTIRRDVPAYEEMLVGFSSKSTALAAARKRINLLSHLRGPLVSPSVRRR